MHKSVKIVVGLLVVPAAYVAASEPMFVRATASPQPALTLRAEPTVSAASGFDPGRMTDEELSATAEKLRKRAALQSMLELADLNVARYEPPSDAVDRVFERNLMASSRISRMQQMIRAEIDRRKA